MLKLPDCAPGSFVVDLGCGNGALAEKLLDYEENCEKSLKQLL